jgi:hypothetical protein
MDDARTRLQATTPAGCRWWRHVALVGAFVAVGLGVALSQLEPLGPRAWLWLPATLLFANFGEYVVHRWSLHVPRFPRAVYHRHVVEHHAFFTFERMAVDGWRDIRWVLFPPWALPLLVGSVLPLFLVLGLVAPPDAAWLFLLGVIAYYGVYEVFHALAHLPEGHALAGSALVRAVTHHHRVHHDPALMRHYNFNFAIPIFDRLFGTVYAVSTTPEAPYPRLRTPV